MSTVKVFNQVQNNNNNLIQMTIELNNNWFAYNSYMTVVEQKDAIAKMAELYINYNIVKIEAVTNGSVGKAKFDFNSYCFKHKVQPYTDFNKMYESMKMIYLLQQQTMATMPMPEKE